VEERVVTVRGIVKKGKVLLDDPSALAEGTTVEVRPVGKRAPASKTHKPEKKPLSLAKRLNNIIGKASGLPPDASVNHDHYLYGLPKRQ